MLIGPPSDTPMTAARSEPAASMTARRSSIRTSSGVPASTGSESPVPRLSKKISRESDAISSKIARKPGTSITKSTFDVVPGTKTTSNGPSPQTRYWAPNGPWLDTFARVQSALKYGALSADAETNAP